MLQAPYKAINQPESSLTIFADILINEQAMLTAYAEAGSKREKEGGSGDSANAKTADGDGNGGNIDGTTAVVAGTPVTTPPTGTGPGAGTIGVGVGVGVGNGEGAGDRTPPVPSSARANAISSPSDSPPRDCVIPILSIDKGTKLEPSYLILLYPAIPYPFLTHTIH